MWAPPSMRAGAARGGEIGSLSQYSQRGRGCFLLPRRARDHLAAWSCDRRARRSRVLLLPLSRDLRDLPNLLLRGGVRPQAVTSALRYRRLCSMTCSSGSASARVTFVQPPRTSWKTGSLSARGSRPRSRRPRRRGSWRAAPPPRRRRSGRSWSPRPPAQASGSAVSGFRSARSSSHLWLSFVRSDSPPRGRSRSSPRSRRSTRPPGRGSRCRPAPEAASPRAGSRPTQPET